MEKNEKGGRGAGLAGENGVDQVIMGMIEATEVEGICGCIGRRDGGNGWKMAITLTWSLVPVGKHSFNTGKELFAYLLNGRFVSRFLMTGTQSRQVSGQRQAL